MTPDEITPAPVDAQLLAHMMACDALLHGSGNADGASSDCSLATTGEDDRARGRLLLLLKMLEAPEIAMDRSPHGDVRTDQPNTEASRPLLGRFQVLRELGSGGFGFVVHARDQLLGRDVALKMPLPERALTSHDLHRFLREARAVARLDHPHIVRVFEAGELGPLGYYIALGVLLMDQALRTCGCGLKTPPYPRHSSPLRWPCWPPWLMRSSTLTIEVSSIAISSRTM